MTEITLSIKKSVEQNASDYFDKSKKAKKKIEGVHGALVKLSKKLAEAEKKEIVVELEDKIRKQRAKRKQEWFEKFHWFKSSEGFLCVGGRDATTNEIVIKKHTDKEDVVFHTEAPGSPFFVIKVKSLSGKKPTKKTFEEVAIATAAFSKAWKLGIGTTEVFMVNPDQVSKEAKSGEYIAKGAFMIYGKREFFHPKVEFAVGILGDGRIMSGPISAVKKNCEKFVSIEQGNDKTSNVAKSIQQKIGGELDELVRAIPAGGCKVKKLK